MPETPEAAKRASGEQKVSPSLAPPPGNPRFPLTDSIRGIGALAVVAGHAAPLSYAHDWWLGRVLANLSLFVYAFFVLSAFLLYRPYLRARARGRPSIPPRKFARRRFLRIVPAYWAALTILAFWPGLPDVHTGHWWIYYGLVHVYSLRTLTGGLGVTWTLCIEASFYVMLPLFAAGMARWSRGKLDIRRELVALAALAVIAPTARFLAVEGALPTWAGFNTLLGYCDFFAAGMALALVSVATEGREDAYRATRFIARYPGTCWALGAISYATICVAFYIVPTGARPQTWLHVPGNPVMVFLKGSGRFWLFLLAATLYVAPAVFGPTRRGLPRRMLALRPLLWVGVISYSLCLWHGPLLGWIAPRIGRNGYYLLGNVTLTLTVAALVIGLPVAWVSYKLFELPFTKRKEARPHRRARFAFSPMLGRARRWAISAAIARR